MKELLPRLKKLYEEDNQQLSNEQVIGILEASYDFSDYVEDFKDLLSTNDVQIRNYQLSTGQNVTNLYGMSIMICTQEVFEDIINDCAREYVFEKINDWLEPFFDFNAYYESCKSDKDLTKLILDYDDIRRWDEVKYNGTSYVIFE